MSWHCAARLPRNLAVPATKSSTALREGPKLLAALSLVVENLRRPDALGPTLERMGAQHVAYGAQEAHYPAVGATLIKTLAEIAGDAWNEQLEQAWSDAYGAISELMLEGALASTAS